jgi:glycosyltransferase involved in cell wall biosynthesis
VRALQLILESLRVQTCKDFDIIISEDGEDASMRQFVEQYDWFCVYQHLTQTDIGWRKNRALNRAVLKANNEWLIFIDGDCVVHHRFVEMHLHYAKADRILLGK